MSIYELISCVSDSMCINIHERVYLENNDSFTEDEFKCMCLQGLNYLKEKKEKITVDNLTEYLALNHGFCSPTPKFYFVFEDDSSEQNSAFKHHIGGF